ncbi:MAG TPA: hypothetical protein PKE30_09305 [Niabella sp.]|nr:hypothetical protein [Niabella sp.]
MDNLKKYLQQHEKAMEVDLPSGELWTRIDKATAKKTRVKLLPLLIRISAAAAAILIVVLGVKLNKPTKEITATVKEIAAPLSAPEKSLSDTGTAVLYPENKTVVEVKEKRALPSVENSQVVKKRNNKETDERYSQLRSFTHDYTQLVDYQLNSIRTTPVYAEDGNYFSDFKQRLKEMDDDERMVRNMIMKNGISNVLLERLINVYQQKLDVLKSLRLEINKINDRVKQQPADSLQIHYLNI